MGACCSCCCDEQFVNDGHNDGISGNGRSNGISSRPASAAASAASAARTSSVQMATADTVYNVAARRRAQKEDDERAMLRKLPSESLAWVQLTNYDRVKGISKPYYWSAITGESVWDKPVGFYSLVDGPRLPARIADLPDCVRVCERFNIRFHLAEENLDDPIFGRLIGGTPPDLAHCLFYQPFLVKELSVYPSEFMRKMGLKQITLMDRLSYDGQARRAITVAGTGTLYLDPGPLAIYYLQDVFHHELFHLLDYPMLAERDIVLSNVIPGSAPSPLPSLPSLPLPPTTINDHTHHTTSTNGDTNSTNNATSNGHNASSLVWRPTDWEARQRRGLLATVGHNGSSSGSDSGSDGGTPTSSDHNHVITMVPTIGTSNDISSPIITHDHTLHGITVVPSLSSSLSSSGDAVTTRQSSQSDGDPIDHRWLSFNPKGFVYGHGGAKTREAGAFLSSGTVGESVVPGFLNRYSMSAPEEDKAEIYAGLFRHAPALLQSDDHIISMKAHEMKERLEGFCPALNDAFWVAVLNHTPLHVKRAREGSWEQKQDPHGHFYWYNSVTLQVSWLKPTLFDSPPPRPVMPSLSSSSSSTSSSSSSSSLSSVTSVISVASSSSNGMIMTKTMVSSVTISPIPLLAPPPVDTSLTPSSSSSSSSMSGMPSISSLPSASTPLRQSSQLSAHHHHDHHVSSPSLTIISSSLSSSPVIDAVR